MTTFEQLEKANTEYEAWLDMYGLLEKLGAVTKEDGKSHPGDHHTPGQELLFRIRLWAYLYADLVECNPNVRKNEIRPGGLQK